MSTNKTQPVQTQTQDVSTPIFQIGISRVGWKPTSGSDRGLVMGIRYLWAEYLDCWQWQYFIPLLSHQRGLLRLTVTALLSDGLSLIGDGKII